MYKRWNAKRVKVMVVVYQLFIQVSLIVNIFYAFVILKYSSSDQRIMAFVINIFSFNTRLIIVPLFNCFEDKLGFSGGRMSYYEVLTSSSISVMSL